MSDFKSESHCESEYDDTEIPPLGEPVIEVKYLKRYGIFVEIRIWHWHLDDLTINKDLKGIGVEDDMLYLPGKYHWLFSNKDKSKTVSMVYEKPMMHVDWRFELYDDESSEEHFDTARTAFSRVRELLAS